MTDVHPRDIAGFNRLADRCRAAPAAGYEPALTALESASEPGPRALLLRAVATAHTYANRVGVALEVLEEATSEAHRSGNPVICGLVETSLGVALTMAGKGEEGIRILDAVVERGLEDCVGEALLARGTMYARAGELERALSDLERSASAFPEDRPALAAILAMNTGVALADLGRLDEARAQTRTARASFEMLDHAEQVAWCTHNLGWIEGIEGNIPAAIRNFDEAEALLLSVDQSVAEVKRDRCEILIKAGLLQEGKALARSALDELDRAGFEIVRAETLLLLAQAHYAAGEPDSAIEAAGEAASAFRSQGRLGWAASADAVATRARLDSEGPSETLLSTIRSMQTAAERSGLRVAVTQTTFLECEILRRLGRLAQARAKLPARLPADLNPEMVLEWWRLKATIDADAGRTAAAARAAASGIDLLRSWQSSVGGSEARAGLAAHGVALGEVGLEIAIGGRSAERTFRWMERTRAGSLVGVRSVSNSVEMRTELARLRSLNRELERAALDGDDAALTEERATAQARVRSLALQAQGRSRDGVSPRGMGELFEALEDRVMVSFADVAGELWGLVIRAGRLRRRRIGSVAEIKLSVDSVRFGLQRSALGQSSQASAEANRALTDAARAEIDDLLIGPLRVPHEELVIVAPPWLHTVPWGLVPSLAGRPVSLSPAAELWLDRTPTTPRTALVAHGPDLPLAHSEASAVARWWPEAVRLVTPTVDAVMAHVSNVDLAHLVAHGRLRADNPLFSALSFSDGDLTVHDLTTVDRLPSIMVLSACDAGLSAHRPGNEIVGLVAELISAGTSTVIAGIGLVPDATETERVMSDLHGELVRGVPAATALARAQAAATARGDLNAATFVCFGRG